MTRALLALQRGPTPTTARRLYRALGVVYLALAWADRAARLTIVLILLGGFRL